jgi:hypothetical protein
MFQPKLSSHTGRGDKPHLRRRLLVARGAVQLPTEKQALPLPLCPKSTGSGDKPHLRRRLLVARGAVQLPTEKQARQSARLQRAVALRRPGGSSLSPSQLQNACTN